MLSELKGLVKGLARPKVLVVGDLILDRYLFGSSERDCQEATAPVVGVTGREDRLGGAANVAVMLSQLGADVALACVIGDDRVGRCVGRIMRTHRLSGTAILTDRTRPTTLKTRYLVRRDGGAWGQVLRVDRETRAPLGPGLETDFLRVINDALPDRDIVFVSDYAKGVCTRRVIGQVIERARSLGRRVLVDPAQGIGYDQYRGASCLTPNRVEASAASGVPVVDERTAIIAGERILRGVGAEAVVVTLDRDGVALVRPGQRHRMFPTTARRVVDVTGAGDMVFAVLGLALMSGAGYEEAVALANYAGGLEVERLGVASFGREDLLEGLTAPSRETASTSQRLSDLIADPGLVLTSV